jgi:hypothetical protein
MKPRLLLTLVGAGLVLVYVAIGIQAGWGAANRSFWGASCARAGLVALAAALAWPQLESIARRLPPWVWAVVGLVGLVVIAYPRLIFVGLALVLAVIALNRGLQWVRRHFFPDR